MCVYIYIMSYFSYKNKKVDEKFVNRVLKIEKLANK